MEELVSVPAEKDDNHDGALNKHVEVFWQGDLLTVHESEFFYQNENLSKAAWDVE